MALQTKMYIKKNVSTNLEAPDDIQWSSKDINGNNAIDVNGVLTTNNVIDLYDYNGRATLDNSMQLKAYINDDKLLGVDDDGVTVLSAKQTLSKISFVTENEIKSISSQNALSEVYHYSFVSSQDKNLFFEDENFSLSWNAPAGYLQLILKTKPLSGNVVSIVGINYLAPSSLLISQLNFNYRLNSSGLSGNSVMMLSIVAENDETYPSYYLNVYNTGSSSNVVVELRKVYLR